MNKLTPELLVKKLNAEYIVNGQLELFQDPLVILRNTPFKDLGKKENQQTIPYWIMNIYHHRGYYDKNNYYWNRVDYDLYKTWDGAIDDNFKFVKKSIGMNQNYQYELAFNFYDDVININECLIETNCWIPYVKTLKYRADLTDEKDKQLDQLEYICIDVNGLFDWCDDYVRLEYFPEKSLIRLKKIKDSQFSSVEEIIMKSFSSFEEFFKYIKDFKGMNSYGAST